MPEPPSQSNYDPQSIIQYFDEFGEGEWRRLVRTPPDEVNLYLHRRYLEKRLAPGSRVLEIGAGAGRFTQILANLGARILVADLSPVQLELNRLYAGQFGFAHAVEDWLQVDICDLSCLEPRSFDAVVAYGGLFSYVLDQRPRALQECLRVLRPGGRLFLSVMSLWGSAHASLDNVLAIPPAANRKIIQTGDITPHTFPGRENQFMHLFRSGELRRWLLGAGLALLDLSASGCLSVTWGEALQKIRDDPEKWEALLQVETEACAGPGCLDMGTHLIAVAEKPENPVD
jgi:SAM-dependent methyltransferase